MRFAEPDFLWVALAAGVSLIAICIYSEWRRARALARFVAARHAASLTLDVSRTRRAIKYALLTTGTVCMFVALARPQLGYHLETRKRAGLDVLFAIDTSKSMLAQDVRPDRLTRAKLAVEDLIQKLPGDRIGLIAFAGDAFLQTPLTLDRVAFREALDALDTHVIPVPGTDVQSALRVSERAFESEPDHKKILILLSDGEDLAGTALDAAHQAARSGVVIYPIGIGTAQGALLPVRNARGKTELLRDAQGELVRSYLDESTLREIARITGGTYHALGQSGQGIEALYRDSLSQLPAHAIEGASRKVFYERFQWPLGLGLALLALEWLVNDHRKRRHAPSAALGMLALVPLMAAGSAHAQDHGAIQSYNQGGAEYRAKQFDRAVQSYKDALASRDLTLQERAYYDMGDALYRQGQGEVKADVQRAIEHYKSAIAAYDSALALNGKDADARWNRDFVQRKLDALQQQQQQSKQDQPRRDQKQGQDRKDQQQGRGQQQQPQTGQNGRQGQQQQQQTAQGQQPQTAQNGRQGQQQQAAQDAQQGQKPPARANGQQTSGAERDQQQAHNGDGAQQATRAAQTGKAPEADDTALAGGLTRREANRLLDSLQGDLQQLPWQARDKHTARPSAERAGKDW